MISLLEIQSAEKGSSCGTGILAVTASNFPALFESGKVSARNVGATGLGI
jgi:hypothetical protein